VYLEAFNFFNLNILIMAKDYKVWKSGATGWWHWECKDGSGSGTAKSRSEARQQGQTNCSGSGFVLIPPPFDIDVIRGFVGSFEVYDLDGKPRRYSSSEISENTFYFLFGSDFFESSKSTTEEKVISYLTIWGIYRGGQSEAEIRRLHDLNSAGYGKIAAKDVNNLIITIEDNDKITWNFSGRP
jgi:hypothetical protein